MCETGILSFPTNLGLLPDEKWKKNGYSFYIYWYSLSHLKFAVRKYLTRWLTYEKFHTWHFFCGDTRLDFPLYCRMKSTCISYSVLMVIEIMTSLAVPPQEVGLTRRDLIPVISIKVLSIQLPEIIQYFIKSVI